MMISPSNECCIFPAQQIVSTSVAAMFTALTMTPFDVVRIRMQSEHHQLIKGDCYVFRNGLGDHICTCFDGSENRAWYNRSIPGKYHGTFDAMFKIARNEGLRSLWSGLPPTLIMSLPNTIIYFTMYEQIKCVFGYEKTTNHPLIPGFAGGLARIAAVIVTSPLELIRTKKMSAQLSYEDLTNSLRNSIKTDGIRALWRGLIPTLWRDLPFSFFYWSAYERLKLLIFERIETTPTVTALCSGAIAGAITTIITHPFDTVKSIRQVTLGNNTKRINQGTIELLHQLYHDEGLRRLYKGLTPRLLKVSPACAIMISTIEFFRQNIFV